MLPLDIDLSPLLINRTAVFSIGRDIAEILAGSGRFAVRHRFFGNLESEWPDAEKAQELLGLLKLARAAAAAGRLVNWLPPGSHPPNGRERAPTTLLLDPLYVLFAPLSHDDIVVCLDVSTLTHPEWHEPVIGRLYQEAFRRILAVGPRIIAISRNTADTFYANFGTDRIRITVVPLYTLRFVEEAAGNGAVVPLRSAAPYFLFVGSLEARKNVAGAISAFAASGLAEEGYRLYIVGGRGHRAEEAEHRAREAAGVVLLGYLDDAELCSAYAGATGFLYPSYLEGFGVPLLEAMAFGIPAIATTAGASPEVGGPLVRYRDPDDHAGMGEELRAIARLTPAERRHIATGLQTRARSEFSFAQFSTRFLAAVEEGLAAA